MVGGRHHRLDELKKGTVVTSEERYAEQSRTERVTAFWEAAADLGGIVGFIAIIVFLAWAAK